MRGLIFFLCVLGVPVVGMAHDEGFFDEDKNFGYHGEYIYQMGVNWGVSSVDSPIVDSRGVALDVDARTPTLYYYTQTVDPSDVYFRLYFGGRKRQLEEGYRLTYGWQGFVARLGALTVHQTVQQASPASDEGAERYNARADLSTTGIAFVVYVPVVRSVRLYGKVGYQLWRLGDTSKPMDVYYDSDSLLDRTARYTVPAGGGLDLEPVGGDEVIVPGEVVMAGRLDGDAGAMFARKQGGYYFYGAGLEADLTGELTLHGEYEQYVINGAFSGRDARVSVFSLSLAYRF